MVNIWPKGYKLGLFSTKKFRLTSQEKKLIIQLTIFRIIQLYFSTFLNDGDEVPTVP